MALRGDFRSDTLTLPTPAMRAAMAAAEVGDDVWGEDPTVQRLEQRVAADLGLEAGLLVPSGTMGNQVAIHTHCQPGDEVLCDRRAHIIHYEGGAVARFTGAQVRALESEDGFPSVAATRAALRSASDVHYPRSRLLVIENTANMAGGRVLGVAGMAERIQAAAADGLLVHIDGARLLNAAVAVDASPAELVRGVDSVTICLSKGLGAPVGSVLCGSAAFVARARRGRKAFGGGMRQAGVLAAAGLLAYDEARATLARDHRRARALGEGLAAAIEARGAGECSIGPVESNIVMLDVPAADAVVAALDAAGIRVAAVSPERVRFVTHRDVDDESVAAAIEAFDEYLAARPAAG